MKSKRKGICIKIMKSKEGENYIDVCLIILCVIIVIALAIKLLPVYIAKNQLDTFATELCREAEISGRVGAETSQRESVLREKTKLNPTVTWSKTGNIQLNEEITVTVSTEMDIGFGSFGSFPVNLKAQASGKSEVYWK